MRRRNVIILVAVIVTLVMGIAAATYVTYFSARALPGVRLAGESVTGKTRDEVSQLLAQRTKDTLVRASFNGTDHEYSLADLGIEIDDEATLDQVFHSNRTWAMRIQGVFQRADVSPIYEIDDATSQEVADAIGHELGSEAQNAKVVPGDEGFVTEDAQAGKNISIEDLVNVGKTATRTLSSQSITLPIVEVQPKISTERAKVLADQANTLIEPAVTIHTRLDAATASVQDKMAWVTIPTEPDQDAEFDAEKIASWVTETADATNADMVPGIKAVNSAGKEIVTKKEGTTGYAVTNADAVAEALNQALRHAQPYEGTFEYDETEPSYENQVIADGAENLAYMAAPGEKWLDLNLSTNSVTAYEGATPVKGPMLIVPGAPGMETPTGQYNIYLKYESQTMRGTNPDGSRYVSPGVRWVSYFVGSIAFHAAPWQSSFGWSGPGGSHGCVNMSTEDAHFVHQWSQMGTVVVSHY